ncbi:hypothetical protein [Porphyromonas loveana]|uniref:hypothetical protein n=1 Tax=Porphyromonas loveana TaxID=1884669 RepID=UPI00359F2B64
MAKSQNNSGAQPIILTIEITLQNSQFGSGSVTGEIQLWKDPSLNKACPYFITSSNFSGYFKGFTFPGCFSDLEDLLQHLRVLGLVISPNPKTNDCLIFQGKKTIGQQSVGMKIYKMSNDQYECVLSHTITPNGSFVEPTLEDIFDSINRIVSNYQSLCFNYLRLNKGQPRYYSNPNY